MMEEGSKEEELECLTMARIALQQGDHARALKFITKARRLDPSLPPPDYLLSSLKPYSPISPNSPPSSPPPNIRHRVRSTFTEQEQISIVNQIKKLNNYYAILGLDRSCSDEDVRKAYRKLSLKVHPDKNNAPGAEEAFKSVSKSFQCLSDEKSRKTYDVSGFESGSESGSGSESEFECGSEKTESQSGFEKTQTSSAQSTWCRYEKPGGHGYNVYNGFFENEFDPEEIFRNFFGMSQPPTTTTTQFGEYTFRTAHTSRRTNGVRMGEEREDDRSGNLDSPFLFLLLAVVIVTLVTIMTVSVPIYKLSNDYPYTIQFTTAKGVGYYVRMADYEKQYPENSPQRVKLESKVESEYFSSLRKRCWAESKRRWWGITRETLNCDRLNHLQAQS